MNASQAEVSSVLEDWSQLRKSAGVSLEEISSQTHIPIRKLEALERHEFDKLGTTTFISGYIRRYAKIIKQDPQVLLQVYLDTLPPQAADVVNETKTVIGSRSTSQVAWKKIGILPFVVFAIVIWGGVMFFMKDNSSDNRAITAQDTAAEQTEGRANNQSPQEGEAMTGDETNEPSSQGNSAQSVDTDLVSPTAEGANVSTSVQSLSDAPEAAASIATPRPLLTPATTPEPTPVATVAATPVPTPTLAPAVETAQGQQVSPSQDTAQLSSSSAGGSQDTLEFSFSEDCWVNVEDATGRVLIAQLKRKGDNLQLFGRAPFNILLGNARAVTLMANGRLVSTEPPGSRKTYRFKVDS